MSALAPALLRLGLAVGAAVVAFAVASAADQDQAHGSDTLLPGLHLATSVVVESTPLPGMPPRPPAATRSKDEAPAGRLRTDASGDRTGLLLRDQPAPDKRNDPAPVHVPDTAKPVVRQVREVVNRVRPARTVKRTVERVADTAVPANAEPRLPLDQVTQLVRDLMPRLGAGIESVGQVPTPALPLTGGLGCPLVTPDDVPANQPELAELTAAAPPAVALGPAATAPPGHSAQATRTATAAQAAVVAADAPRPPPTPELPAPSPSEVAAPSVASAMDLGGSCRLVTAPPVVGRVAFQAAYPHPRGRAPQPDASPA